MANNYNVDGATSAITNKAIIRLESIFEAGIGLRSTPLKNYSGPALEGWTEYVLSLICKTLQEQYPEARIEFDKAYIKSDFPNCSDERLDMHVKVNGLYVYLQEDRAWLDKPFYSLKRAVFKAISVSCKSKLHPNCQYAAVGYCCDFKQELVNTFNLVFGMSDCITTYSLTGRRRNIVIDGKQCNWFETGFQHDVVENLVKYIYQIIENAIIQR